MRALLVYPTHANCAEVAAEASQLGLDAAVYPGRNTKGDEVNCWNMDADEAERIGFPVVKTVCIMCPHHKTCAAAGYLAQLITVQDVRVALCTHKRAEYSGLRELCADRQYLSIHENAISILRPECDCCSSDLLLIQLFLQRLLNDPKSLDWFGDAVRVDDQGQPISTQNWKSARNASMPSA